MLQTQKQGKHCLVGVVFLLQQFLVYGQLITDSSPPSNSPSIQLPSSSPSTSAAPSTSPAPSQIPSFAGSPTVSVAPTTLADQCTNTPNWSVFVGYDSSFNYVGRYLPCDDARVACWEIGRVDDDEFGFAYASDHCCRCKPQCSQFCSTATPTPYPTYFYPTPVENETPTSDLFGNTLRFVLVGLGAFICIFLLLQGTHRQQQRQRDVDATRRRMSHRRRQRRQGGSAATGGGSSALNGNAEEERAARYELILSKFSFQTVLADKSNTTPESIRTLDALEQRVSSGKTTTIDEEAAADGADGTDKSKHNSSSSSAVASPSSRRRTSTRPSVSITRLSRRISSWRHPSPKDECCICLESYSPGETICVAKTEECDHVFHEECVVEWLQNHDRCPLCRVDLIN